MIVFPFDLIFFMFIYVIVIYEKNSAFIIVTKMKFKNRKTNRRINIFQHIFLYNNYYTRQLEFLFFCLKKIWRNYKSITFLNLLCVNTGLFCQARKRKNNCNNNSNLHVHFDSFWGKLITFESLIFFIFY